MFFLIVTVNSVYLTENKMLEKKGDCGMAIEAPE